MILKMKCKIMPPDKQNQTKPTWCTILAISLELLCQFFSKTIFFILLLCSGTEITSKVKLSIFTIVYLSNTCISTKYVVHVNLINIFTSQPKFQSYLHVLHVFHSSNSTIYRITFTIFHTWLIPSPDPF